jgi:signal transduction histidine kinase
MCRVLAVICAPAALVGVFMRSPFGLVDRALILAFAIVVVVIARLSRDAHRTRPLAAVFIAVVLGVSLMLTARNGLSPANALGLGDAILLVAVFFGARAMWLVLALTTLSFFAMAIGNRTGMLHPADPAILYDWSRTSTWIRMAAGFVCAISLPAAAVAAIITNLEQAVAAEKRARLERATLLEAAREGATRAEIANRMKDHFLSTVSHELRTPLTAITGWAHMLRSGSAPPERMDHALEVIVRNANAQEKLIGDLLDVSRITAGRLRLDVAEVEPATFVRLAVESVGPAAESRGIRIDVAIDGDATVAGDVARLQQVVSNLLTNAVKFSPDDSAIEVTVRHEPPDVTIAVRDHGQGIRAEFLPHLFEPFRQAEPGFARPHGGLGLGLTIAKSLVALHAGTIEARSDGVGTGATLVVRLPCAAHREGRPERRSWPSQPALEGESGLGGLHVLLVEDEPDTREMLLALFESCGASASGASSAAEALEQFHRQRPNVIVSDIGLRGEDGLSLIRKLRLTPGGASIPALGLTAFVRTEDRDAVLAAGFDVHVPKPVEPEPFLREVLRLVRRRSGRDPTLVATIEA